MNFSKRWKSKWELKSLTHEELLEIVREVIVKQLDEIEKSDITLKSNLVIVFEADSVDIVAMLLYLEDLFKKASESTKTVVPTDKLAQIVLVEDIFDVIYEVLMEIETKMENFSPIKADFSSLDKQKKMGELYN